MKILADSGCEFTQQMINKEDINIARIPLTLQLNDEQYIDDGSIDIRQYLNAMKQLKTVPKTAAPSPELYFDKFKEEGGSIFCVTLSSHLSASYSNAMIAKDMYLEEFGNKFIHIFDSLSASVGETLISFKINEYIKGKLTDTDIVENINKFIQNMKTYFILESYDNIVKNGRMNPYVAKLCSLLSIRPICFGNNGKMDILDKAMGFNKTIDKLVKYIQKEAVDSENRILGISHVDCPEKAEIYMREITKKVKFKDAFIVQATGLCSTYADDGGIIIAF